MLDSPSNVTFSARTAKNGDPPDQRRHMPQWQALCSGLTFSAVKRTAPHKHWPAWLMIRVYHAWMRARALAVFATAFLLACSGGDGTDLDGSTEDAAGNDASPQNDASSKDVTTT